MFMIVYVFIYIYINAYDVKIHERACVFSKFAWIIWVLFDAQTKTIILFRLE